MEENEQGKRQICWERTGTCTLTWRWAVSGLRGVSPSASVHFKNIRVNMTVLFLVSTAADARRTIRRGHTRFKQPGSPAGKAGNAGPAPGSSPRARRAAWTERRALPAQSVLGLQGRRPEVVRAARGRCGPRLRPRPGCGGRCPWPPAGGGRPCLDSTHPFPSRLIRGSTKIILGHLNKTYAGLNLFRSLISLAFPGVCKFGGKTATMFFFVTYD